MSYMRVARAKAEERRALAVAMERENVAKIRDAEAKIPEAMADSFRTGNLGIMDYQRIKNIQADTEMRKSISKDEEKHES